MRCPAGKFKDCKGLKESQGCECTTCPGGKYKDARVPMFGKTKFQSAASADLQKQAGAIKAYAMSLLLEHGMKPTDFDKNKMPAGYA